MANEDKKRIPWLQIISIVVSIFVFLFGGGYFYNNVINRPILTYTLLPNYDLGNQFFNGVVIENRGRENQTDINIAIGSLDSEITMLHFPGIQEPTNIITGGVGAKSVLINMPRLSSGKALSVYFLTLHPIHIDGANILLSSSETVGQPSGENISVWSVTSIVSAAITVFAAIFSIWSAFSLQTTVSKRKEKEYITMQELLKVIQAVDHLEKDTTQLSDSTNKLDDRAKALKSEQDELKTQQDDLKISFSQLEKIKTELSEKLEFASKSITELEISIRKSLELGELDPDERTDKILAILEQFQESIQKSTKTTGTFTDRHSNQ